MTEIQKLNKKLDLLIQANDKPLTTEETCQYLGIKKPTLYALTSGKKIPHYKPNGSLLYFKKSDLNNFVFSNKVEKEI